MRLQLPLRALATAMAAVCISAAQPAFAGDDASGIHWVTSNSAADVDAAFAQARDQNRPLFLYWGAKWCPPCNHVKSTVFNRADFIAQTRSMIAVNLDGDTPSAQKLGARFKVSGYPTMVVFDPKGRELTRLPGEVEPAVYLHALQAALGGGRPMADVVAAARRGERLDETQCRQAAWYAWETAEARLLQGSSPTATLLKLASACDTALPVAGVRLRLKAAAGAADDKRAATALTEEVKFSIGATAMHVLGDGSTARQHLDIVTEGAKDIVSAISRPGSPERSQLVAAWDDAARRLAADPTLSRTDRIAALDARVELARIDDTAQKKAPLPADLVADARRTAAQFDREITDPYERQAVITEAAYLLKEVGLLGESDTLLQANLSRSHSPYYLMSELASNAKERGDRAAAIEWSRKAWESAQGPATRLQWGSGYIRMLVGLAPEQSDRIERAASAVFTEAASTPDAFYERNAAALRRIGLELTKWNASGEHKAVIERLSRQLAPVCARLPQADTGRATCRKLLSPDAAMAA